MTTCALIAAYNESSTIMEVVRGVLPHVAHAVVIDDGSTDGTGELAVTAGAEVMRHRSNRGKGVAIRSGLTAILRGNSPTCCFSMATCSTRRPTRQN
jgi:glycosyltransferase involved in cell wall biosynthesis